MEAEGVRIVNLEEMQLKRRTFADGYAFDRHEVVADEAGRGYCVRVYSIPPGSMNYPYHAHETHEEIFFIISGAGTVKTPDGDRPLRAGDVLVCPRGPAGAHRITNTGNVPLLYIEFDRVVFPDVAYYPLSGGMGVLFSDRDRNEFYLDGARVPYDELCKRG